MSVYTTSQSLKEGLDKIDHLLYPLIRWILTSNRAHVAKLKDNELVTGIGSKLQFCLLSTPPKKEKRFIELESKKGSFRAFHGSAFGNWHSILRGGLRNLSM